MKKIYSFWADVTILAKLKKLAKKTDISVGKLLNNIINKHLGDK